MCRSAWSTLGAARHFWKPICQEPRTRHPIHQLAMAFCLGRPLGAHLVRAWGQGMVGALIRLGVLVAVVAAIFWHTSGAARGAGALAVGRCGAYGHAYRLPVAFSSAAGGKGQMRRRLHGSDDEARLCGSCRQHEEPVRAVRLCGGAAHLGRAQFLDEELLQVRRQGLRDPDLGLRRQGLRPRKGWSANSPNKTVEYADFPRTFCWHTIS